MLSQVVSYLWLDVDTVESRYDRSNVSHEAKTDKYLL
jgi:hypothetical protein